MRKFLFLFLLPFIAAVAVSCDEGNEFDNYNADAAVTSYKPIEGFMVASVKTTKESNGRLFSWKHTFSYDKKNRIKSIDSEIVHHQKASSGKWYICNISSRANYYFKDDNYMKVRYNVSRSFPDYPRWDNTLSGTYGGTFNNEGWLGNFGPFDCEYSGGTLSKVYMDNSRIYTLQRDTYGNVKGYVCDSMDVRVAVKEDIYKYEPVAKNNTNFDFSAYIGNWVMEREIPDCTNWPYAPFQLAAFGMFGYSGLNLPSGEWEFNESGAPILFTDERGFRTEIQYLQ